MSSMPSHGLPRRAESSPPPPGDQGASFELLVSSVTEYSIVMLGVDGRISSWNAGARRIKGYEAPEIIGEPYERFFTLEDRAAGRPARLLGEAQRLGFVHDEGWRLRKDGAKFWASATLTALHDRQSGQLCGFGKVTHDETAKHEAEERLRQSEERFRLSISALREQAFFMLSPTGTVENWNSGAQLIMGYTDAEVIGQNFAVFFTPEDRQGGKPQRELALAMTNGSYEEEGWRLRKDGSRFWAAVIVTAVFDQHGRLRGYTKVTRNETERHHSYTALGQALLRAQAAEKQVREHAEELERRVHERTGLLSQKAEELARVNAELEQFASIASHDLKDPLRMITSYLSLVRHRFEHIFQPPAGPYLLQVEKSAQRMSEMIDAVLEYAHSSNITDNFAPVVLADAATQAIGNLQHAIADSQADIRIETLPKVQGSAPHLCRVFQNLIGNAIKFRSAAPPAIVIDALASDDMWVVSIRDNGIGIDPASHELAFRIFQRLHPQDTFAGNGIGLATCKRIIESHHGRIWVESAVGAGTTMRFSLPRLRGDYL